MAANVRSHRQAGRGQGGGVGLLARRRSGCPRTSSVRGPRSGCGQPGQVPLQLLVAADAHPVVGIGGAQAGTRGWRRPTAAVPATPSPRSAPRPGPPPPARATRPAPGRRRWWGCGRAAATPPGRRRRPPPPARRCPAPTAPGTPDRQQHQHGHARQEREGDEAQVGVDRGLADRVEHPPAQVSARVQRVPGQEHGPGQHQRPARGHPGRRQPRPLATGGPARSRASTPQRGQAADGERPDGVAAVDGAQLHQGQGADGVADPAQVVDVDHPHRRGHGCEHGHEVRRRRSDPRPTAASSRTSRPT